MACQLEEDRQGNALEKPENKKSFSWTTDSIKLLLNLRLDMEESFNKPTCKKNKLWHQIANKMIETVDNSNFTWEECYGKYRNLLQTYRNNKAKRLKNTGESKITWEYFEVFDSVLGQKASTCPPVENLSSSLVETTTAEGTSYNSEVSSASNEDQKKRKSQEISLSHYLYLKTQKEDTKWEERKALKGLEIQALNNLAEAIRGTGQVTMPKKRKVDPDSE